MLFKEGESTGSHDPEAPLANLGQFCDGEILKNKQSIIFKSFCRRQGQTQINSA